MRSTPHFFKGQMPERISDIIISTARELLIVERRYLALDLARDKILAAGGNFEEKKAVCERDLAVVISRCSARIIDNKIKELICFEVISSSEWSYPTNFKPNYFVNIKSQLDKKIKAMQAYRNEIRKFPHPRSTDNLKMVAGRWGAISGNYAAEAFEIIRKIDK